MKSGRVVQTGVMMVVLALVFLTCTKDEGSAPQQPSDVSFAGNVQPIFTNRCVNAGCHPGNGAPFSLQAGASYNALVGDTATTGACAGTLLRVRPSFADSSALVRRIEGTACGLQMPFGGSPLPQSEITVIRDWINQGADNN